jgi:hypothetical protein
MHVFSQLLRTKGRSDAFFFTTAENKVKIRCILFLRLIKNKAKIRCIFFLRLIENTAARCFSGTAENADALACVPLHAA